MNKAAFDSIVADPNTSHAEKLVAITNLESEFVASMSNQDWLDLADALHQDRQMAIDFAQDLQIAAHPVAAGMVGIAMIVAPIAAVVFIAIAIFS